ncbi:MAG: L,D-transpeptidase family protein [Clostridium sp.]|nr:L,D-transpeptidase family protein [Clostridium sp.]MCM1208031.1 L,D-transpeptidase family protein [Ruminococcus sp.]
MGRRNRKRNRKQNKTREAEKKIISTDKEDVSVDKNDDLEKEILSEIQDKKNNPASEDKNEKRDLLSEIVEDVKREAAKKDAEADEEKTSDSKEETKADEEKADKEKTSLNKEEAKADEEKADEEKTSDSKEEAKIDEEKADGEKTSPSKEKAKTGEKKADGEKMSDSKEEAKADEEKAEAEKTSPSKEEAKAGEEKADEEKAEAEKTSLSKEEAEKDKDEKEKTDKNKKKIGKDKKDRKEKKHKEKSDKEKADDKKEEAEKDDTKKDKDDKEDSASDKGKDEAAAAIALDMPLPYIDPSIVKYKKKKKTARLAWIVSVSVVVAVYIGGFIISSIFFYGNTKVNGIDVSGMKVTEAQKLLVDDMNTYTLEVKFSNGTETLKVGDGGLSLALAQSMKDIKKKQQPYLWFMHFGKTYEYDVKFIASFNDSEMSEFLMSYDAMKKENMTKSKNATVDMSSGVAQIIPDETGTVLDTDSVYDVVSKALENGDASVDIAEAGCYVEADIQADSPSIVSGYSAAEEFLSIDAVYDFAGCKIAIPKEELAAMAYLDGSGNLKISKDKVYSYAAKFAEQYTTAGTERRFKTHDGDIIGIYGKNYGWIIDEEKEAEELYELICKKESFTKEPACKKTGYAMGEMNDIGDTYIEIDLTNQHLYYYVDGKLVLDNDIVSGWLYNPNNYKTPGGLFGMDNKAYKVDLVGENYRTPVNYWMGFNGGIGIHDATWRSRFGGDIYKYDGSHGCINLPLSFAAQVYEIAEPGMPVLCYWLDEVTFYSE